MTNDSDNLPLHPTAASGFSRQAEAYAKARPEYPKAAENWLQTILKVGPNSKVLEVGAGTGKFTKRLVDTGANVVAVEPIAAMREQFRKLFPTLTPIAATAEQLPFSEQSFDAVVCAQSFHWFATTEVLKEFARVLRPGGHLGLIWNIRDESVPWVAKLGELWREKEGKLPRYHQDLLTNLFPHPDFGQLRRKVYQHSQVGPAEKVVIERMRSTSFVAAMAASEQEAFLHKAREILDQEPNLATATSVEFPYITHMYHCRRR